ncbi:hypothetical protein GCM10017581_080580 [Dactylosporangium matsuzakiense]|uniref:Uncharacterized protein n=1 Tax=Dactylosporangium matsuzakiense TaxID=53360 RepID=A0A9W6KVN1_9ACTN|nr:hypothetical protein GCM10017581_080580 [Dactylosporangium matsuzakiense]
MRRVEAGIEIVGVSSVLSLPGGRLEAVLGAEADVDAALAGGDADAILAAQRRVVQRELRYMAADRRTSAVASVADDGAALLLRTL